MRLGLCRLRVGDGLFGLGSTFFNYSRLSSLESRRSFIGIGALAIHLISRTLTEAFKSFIGVYDRLLSRSLGLSLPKRELKYSSKYTSILGGSNFNSSSGGVMIALCSSKSSSYTGLYMSSRLLAARLPGVLK